jgi:flavorubredoxin
MTQALQDMKIKTISDGISIQFVPDHSSLKECVDLGRELAKAIKNGD